MWGPGGLPLGPPPYSWVWQRPTLSGRLRPGTPGGLGGCHRGSRALAGKERGCAKDQVFRPPTLWLERGVPGAPGIHISSPRHGAPCSIAHCRANSSKGDCHTQPWKQEPGSTSFPLPLTATETQSSQAGKTNCLFTPWFVHYSSLEGACRLEPIPSG